VNDYVVGTGEFNRHHPLWDNGKDEQLFTNEAIVNADLLINWLIDWNMDMPLPKGILTLKHFIMKKYSQPDNMFCTDNLTDYVIKCNTMPQLQPPKTNHFPIITILDLPTKSKPSPDYPSGMERFQ
jgi:hypothetical protein